MCFCVDGSGAGKGFGWSERVGQFWGSHVGWGVSFSVCHFYYLCNSWTRRARMDTGLTLFVLYSIDTKWTSSSRYYVRITDVKTSSLATVTELHLFLGLVTYSTEYLVESLIGESCFHALVGSIPNTLRTALKALLSLLSMYSPCASSIQYRALFGKFHR